MHCICLDGVLGLCKKKKNIKQSSIKLVKKRPADWMCKVDEILFTSGIIL